MPSCKRRLSQLHKENVKTAKNNSTIFKFFGRSNGTSSCTGSEAAVTESIIVDADVEPATITPISTPQKPVTSCTGSEAAVTESIIVDADVEPATITPISTPQKPVTSCTGSEAAVTETIIVDADVEPATITPISTPQKPVTSCTGSEAAVTESIIVDADVEPATITPISTPQKPVTRKKNRGGHKVGFNKAWQNDRPWLTSKLEEDEDSATEGMFCTICQDHQTPGMNGSKVWVEKGCRTLRLDKVKEHETSSQHKTSLTMSLATTLPEVSEKVNTEAEKAIVDALQVLYFIVTKNLPLSLFSSMVDLCIDVGSASLSNLRLAKNATYSSWDVVQELISLLSDSVRSCVRKSMKSSASYSVMVDEVCDLTTTKHVALCCKYVNNGEVHTSFLSDTAINEANANNLVTTIRDELQDNGLQLINMTGFASDGAAVFTGKKNGVAKQLRYINPKMITTHCKDHRLALACRDSFASEPIFKKLDETLDALFIYYNYSANRKASLRDVQEAYEQAPLTIKQAKHHRWLSHEKAVQSIVRSYSAIITDLEENTISKDPQGNGILKTLVKPDTLRILLMLADVLPHVTGLSLFFQQRDIHIGEVSGKVERAMKNISKLKTVNGPWLNKADAIMEDAKVQSQPASDAFNKSRVSFLDRLMANVEARFKDTDVLDQLAVLDTSRHDELPSLHGNYEMECLAAHYAMPPEDLLFQWMEVVELLKTRPPQHRTLPELLKLFYSDKHAVLGLRGQYPLVAELVSAACVMPLSTAEVERVFSQLKLVKTAHRCSLKTSTVDKLLNIKLNCHQDLFDDVKSEVVCSFFKKNRKLNKVCK